MARKKTGSVYSDGWSLHAKISGNTKRYDVRFPDGTSMETAKARAALMASLVERLGVTFAHRADTVLERVANAKDAASLEKTVRAVDLIIAGKVSKANDALTNPTVRELGEEWTSGKLRDRFPQLKAKKTSVDDAQRLRDYVYPHVGAIRIKSITAEHGNLVLTEIPKKLSERTIKAIAQAFQRIVNIAVSPMRLLERSPLPDIYVPSADVKQAKQMLFPNEEALIVSCKEIPMLYRILYGFLCREGMRISEAEQLQWGDVDLALGYVTLDENKSDDPRAWVLGTDTVRTLRWWKTQQPKGQFVFGGEKPIKEHKWAETFREHVALAGVKRTALFKRSKKSLRLRIHDTRATFVTVSLANGKSESWVTDRTGHKSHSMVQAYTRQVRSARELNQGDFCSLFDALGASEQLSGNCLAENPLSIESLAPPAKSNLRPTV